jgi:hypothetical protein
LRLHEGSFHWEKYGLNMGIVNVYLAGILAEARASRRDRPVAASDKSLSPPFGDQ